MFRKIELRAIVASIAYHVAAVAVLYVGGLLGWLALLGIIAAAVCVCTCVANKNN